MARLPDEGRTREDTIHVRVTAALRASIDKDRGPVRISTWMRQAAIEKLERGK